MKKAIIVSGYFNPIHKGHLDLFRKAKDRGDMLIVIVNSDIQSEQFGIELIDGLGDKIQSSSWLLKK